MPSQDPFKPTSNHLDAFAPEIRASGDMPPEPQNFGMLPEFGAVAVLLDALQLERKHERRRSILFGWFQFWRQRVGPNVYPALRLILPKQDKERAIYHSKEANIAKSLIRAMGIEGTPDAFALMNWRRPSGRDQNSVAGDFPGLAYQVVAGRSTQLQGSLRINEVNDLLDELSRKGSRIEHQTHVWSQFYDKCTPNEIRWIIKIILKDLNAGAKETTVLSVFHPDAIALFNSCSDLKRVSYELWDSHRRIDDSDKNVQVFRMFAPMLSKRPPKELIDAIKKFGGITFMVEEKLDGERIQLHKRGDSYYYASRKGKNYTYLYGASSGTGSLTPHIHRAFNPEVYECILDGEMLVWDPFSERYLPFGTLKSHAGEKAAKGTYNPRPCFKVFDLLFLNGKSLTHESLAYRRRNLKRVFNPLEGRLEVVSQKAATTTADVQKLLRDVIESRGEGLILKHPNSIYVLNGRLDHWIKIKPEYMDGEGETMDLLVVGGNYGKGWRGGGVSTLICAVRDDRQPNSDITVKWASFVRIGSGLSFADLVTIRSKPWIDWGIRGPPFLQTAPRSQEDKGDVYLKPEDSLVLTVKGAEIMVVDTYHVGKTLRFPRAVRIREDAGPEDCATVSDLERQFAEKKKQKQEEEATGSNKRRKAVTGKAKALVSQNFQATKQESPPTSDIFAGRQFVPPDPQAKRPFTKPELEALIQLNGGCLLANRRVATDVTIVWANQTQRMSKILKLLGHSNERAAPDIKSAINDNVTVVQPQWVSDCVRAQIIIPLRKRYLHPACAQKASDTEESTETSDQEMGEQNEIVVKEGGSEAKLQTPSTPDKVPSPEESEESIRKGLEASINSEWVNIGPQGALYLDHLLQEEHDEEFDHEEPGDEGFEPEDWSTIFDQDTASSEIHVKAELDSRRVVMGETEDSMEYDQELIFRHLVFYLDSSSNATLNGLGVSISTKVAIDASFERTAEQILKLGGRITADIGEPKLTHVVMHNDDLSRRTTLMRMTERPKRRRFVLIDWVDACIEERTLLNEDDFLP